MIFFPSFNPNENLIKTIDELLIKGIKNDDILIVNDGSRIGLDIFEFLKNKGIKILNHDKNYGKGKAIKTALQFAKDKNIKFSICADSDGQHHVDDIYYLYMFSKSERFDFQKLVITQRNFEKKMPIASKFGNFISSLIINLIYKKKFKDTQCGLRLIPYKKYDSFLKFKNNGFDFEMKCLLFCLKNNSLESDIYIKSIYTKDRYTNFKKIEDSLLILIQIFRRD